MVTPLFILLVMAMFEFGFLLHNYLQVSGASSAAVRTLTVAGNDPDADFLAMQTLDHGLSTFDPVDVTSVIVYRADGPAGELPLACTSNPIPDGVDCNRYSGADFFLSATDSGGNPTGNWGCDVGARDVGWCPMDRQANLSDPGGPDYIGIHIEVNQRNLSGMFNIQDRLEISRVARIEPAGN